MLSGRRPTRTPPPADDDPRRTRRTEAGGTGEQRYAGHVCPAHVKAAFNFEFDDIDIDVPLEELLVEATKETPRWRAMLTPLPGAAGETDSQPTPGCVDRAI